jgi:hypothetical protein
MPNGVTLRACRRIDLLRRFRQAVIKTFKTEIKNNSYSLTRTHIMVEEFGEFVKKLNSSPEYLKNILRIRQVLSSMIYI